ncbi:MAG: helix-turn-helix domain-containing protein [Bacteroidia bacterium]
MNARNRKKLEEHYAVRHKNVAKFLNRVTHHFRNEATESMRSKGFAQLRMGHASLLYNIGLEGINVNQLAKRAFMTKQAMSKLVQELLNEGYIKTQEHETDKRSFNVFITDKGASLMFEMDKCVMAIQQRYISIVGERNFKIMLDSLGKILDDYQKE